MEPSDASASGFLSKSSSRPCFYSGAIRQFRRHLARVFRRVHTLDSLNLE
ncbi:hypothetical protein THTE_1138 [Thermogutta terrifontis]|uniref:Uncharacterized protein n=1 Tax=Thermogutta terrifontis TaxID=1331910 RepID=A0A286RCQ6_9BACT|nr:hypothetical protein THTE_1138 [Thermogutta terrifontis]